MSLPAGLFRSYPGSALTSVGTSASPWRSAMPTILLPLLRCGGRSRGAVRAG
jgi:hypothetical protein